MSTLEQHSTGPGRYVTDGTHLFRHVTPPGRPPDGGFVELEDAGSLERVLLRSDDLSRLRRVTPDDRGG